MAEDNESFQKRKIFFQTSKIEALENKISELKVKLVEANNEIERLDHILKYRVEKINNKAA